MITRPVSRDGHAPIVMRDGEVEQQGAPLDLFERPVNQFVAGFLGSPSMNFLPATLSGDDLLLEDGQRIALTRQQCAACEGRSAPLIWGVRPEHFRLEDQPAHALQARIEIVQPTGSRQFGSFTIGRERVVAELDAHAGGLLDAPVTLAVAMDRTILIDAETRRTLHTRAL